jgi:hypothetical protein
LELFWPVIESDEVSFIFSQLGTPGNSATSIQSE